jgi:hypothetical protein
MVPGVHSNHPSHHPYYPTTSTYHNPPFETIVPSCGVVPRPAQRHGPKGSSPAVEFHQLAGPYLSRPGPLTGPHHNRKRGLVVPHPAMAGSWTLCSEARLYSSAPSKQLWPGHRYLVPRLSSQALTFRSQTILTSEAWGNGPGTGVNVTTVSRVGVT